MGRDRRGVKSIFDEAAEIASPEVRAAYLDSACGVDAHLRKMVVVGFDDRVAPALMTYTSMSPKWA